jgi:DNA-binding NarL/FixJ family response regulator
MEIHVRDALDQRTYRHAGKGALTPKQLAVLHMIAAGLSDTEIAAAMYVSETTTKRHVRDILSKLDARNRANAVHIAHRKGIIP